jgi:Rieske 2Fe-2S family protein
MTATPTDFRRAAVRGEARTLPGPSYTDPSVFAAERERIFFRDWVCVGRAGAIAEPGTLLTIDLLGESLLLVRGRDGVARGFYNVCRHRGARLCDTSSGRVGGALRCPYHAWSYGLDGQLLAAPNMQDLAHFDRDDYPLKPIAIEELEGFLFACLADDPEPFAEAFATLDGRFAAWGLATLREGHRVAYDVRTNWKQIMENYSECYHCGVVHPELCRLSPPTSGRNDLLAGPFLGGYMTLHEHAASLTEDGRSPRPPLPGISGENLSRVYFYALFPNWLLSLHPDYAMAHWLWPRAPGLTRVECAWLFDPATLAAPGFDPSDAVTFWDRVNRQDWAMCERAFQGVGSRSYTPGPYANAEGLLDAFDREYERRMADRSVDD